SGDSICFVTGNEAGSFDALVSEWLVALGANPRVVHEPFGYEAIRQANEAVFGTNTIPRYDFAAAQYVISFGSDFMETWLSPVEQTRDFSAGHSYHEGSMGRYVHVEPRMSMTAMSADEWVAPNPGTEGTLALGIAHVIVRDRMVEIPSDMSRVQELLDRNAPATVSSATGVSVEVIERLGREFASHPSLAVAGGMGAQHDQAHSTVAAASILNYVAGNIGNTVVFGPDAGTSTASSYSDLTSLVGAMRDGGVGVLFVHGANPAYATPAGLGFRDAMRQVGFKVSFSRFLDDTAMEADLVLPDHDPLEQWNDFEPRAGIHALQQPVMQPVFDTRQTGDVLLAVAAQLGGAVAGAFTAANYKEYLQNRWRGLQRDRRPFDVFWNEALQRGGMWTDAGSRNVRLTAGAAAAGDEWARPGGEQLTLIAYPSPSLHDGRGANRPWLQELPDPVTKLTWNSWLEINPHTAERLGIADGEMIEVTSAHGSVTVPAYLYPGIREDTVAMPTGQGHRWFGRYAGAR
ncbi:MAG: molybdopterin-dependent oxidoreductase, partial [Gemmatimonadota bacterium]